MLGISTKLRYQYNLIEYDKKLNNMLKDVQIKGEQSQYNGFSEVDKNKLLNDFIKKNKRTHIYFKIFGYVLITLGIFILF